MTDETRTPPTGDETALQARVEEFWARVGREMVGMWDRLRAQRPGFVFGVLADILRGSLQSLHHYIADPAETEVSWENPWTELHFSMSWDFVEEGPILHRPTEIPKGILADLREGGDPFSRDLMDPVTLEVFGVVAAALAQSAPHLLLLTLTHHMAVRVKDGEEIGFWSFVPEEWISLETLPEVERAARWEELRQPFSIGGLEVENENGESLVLTPLDHPEAAPGTLPGWAEAVEERRRKLPELHFTGEANGIPHKGSVVMMVHPLVVDEDKREAYFPIVTGLVLSPATAIPEGKEDETLAALNPDSWSLKERAALWELLLEEIPRKLEEEERRLEDEAKERETTPVPPPALEGVTAVAEVGSVAVTVEAPPVVHVNPEDLKKVGAPPPERRRTAGVAFGHAIASAQAMTIVQGAHKVRLPNKWSTLPRWKDLAEKEVQELLDEEGERAFEDLKKSTGDADERGPLLRRLTKADGTKVVALTEEGKDRLRRRAGLGRGYLDVDRYGQERLYRLFEVRGGGLLEIGLSWYGLAGPLANEWRATFKRQAEELARDLQKEPPLFTELDEEERKRVERLMAQVTLWEDGRRIMEAILGQVGKQGRNPVEIPAEAFRVLLWPREARSGRWPKNWKQRVEGALTALNALTFSMKTYRMEPVKGYGSMVGQWTYRPMGPGDHGDGVYIIDVTSGFIGCLEVFQSGKTKLRSGRDAVSFHFTKDLTKEERAALGWGKKQKAVDSFVTFDAGRAFYNAAAGLTPTQENLLKLVESRITRKGHTARKGNKAAQVSKRLPAAKEDRLYTSAFCPLLPEGRSFVGALGNFIRNPEAGFTLGGAESRTARRTGGLLSEMGYTLQAGAARVQRAEVITKALEDLKAVVVDYLGGLVVGHDGTRWVPFEDFPTLDERTLTKKLRLFLFLPQDWREQRRAKWEEETGRRVTEDPAEAEREMWEGEVPEEDLGREVASSADGFRGWPLARRFAAMIRHRGVRQKHIAVMLGVSAMTISYWVTGKKKIPQHMEPLVVRWVETGTPPTAEERAALAARRRGGKKSGARSE